MDRETILREKIRRLPKSAGVYIMKSSNGEILYIGKASSLRERVKSYLYQKDEGKTLVMFDKVADIEYIECSSIEQALILEAALIKEKKPRYNIVLKDDKSYPYIEITREEFPRVRIIRMKDVRKKVFEGSLIFGPYPQVKTVKASLDNIRKIFPFCSCGKRRRKECLYYHIKLCPAPCIGKVSASVYNENIKNLICILKGERKELIASLKKKMRELSSKLEFEKAMEIRDKLWAVENLYHGRGVIHDLIALKEELKLAHLPLVIEGVDISSLHGKYAVGAIVVFHDGYPLKSAYRRYRIKEANVKDDYDMIAEVVRRRYRKIRDEKGVFADLIIVDGGRAHLNRVYEELRKLGIDIPVISIAKQNEEIWTPHNNHPLILKEDNPALHLIQQVRDEAHRFAHKYHLYRRSKELKEVS